MPTIQRPEAFCEGCALADPKLEDKLLVTEGDRGLMDHALLSLGGLADELEQAQASAEEADRDFYGDPDEFPKIAGSLVDALIQPYLGEPKDRTDMQKAYAACMRRIASGACEHFFDVDREEVREAFAGKLTHKP